jgi:hypothetical protein
MTLAKSEQSEARSVSGIIPHSGDEIEKASGSSVIIHRYRKLNINNLTVEPPPAGAGGSL